MAKNEIAWGIDVGVASLKALRCRRGSAPGSLEILQFEQIEHRKFLTAPGADADEIFAETLTRFLARNKVKGEKIAISVPDRYVVQRYFSLPPTEPKKIDDQVKSEVIRLFSTELDALLNNLLDELLWDYRQIGAAPEKDSARDLNVFASVMKRKDAKRAIKRYASAGIDVDCIQAETLAIYNAFLYERYDDELWRKDPAETNDYDAILCVGTTDSKLLITNGVSLWTRIIPIGGNSFTRELAKTRKISNKEAERLKREVAQAADPKAIVLDMKPIFGDMLSEVYRAIKSYRKLNAQANIRRVYTLGATMKLPGLQRFLAKSLGYDVVGFSPVKRFVGSVFSSDRFQKVASSFGAAYGLALLALDSAPLDINLISRNVLKGRRNVQKKTESFWNVDLIEVVKDRLMRSQDQRSNESEAPVKEAPIKKEPIAENAGVKATPPKEKNITTEDRNEDRPSQNGEEVLTSDEIFVTFAHFNPSKDAPDLVKVAVENAIDLVEKSGESRDDSINRSPLPSDSGVVSEKNAKENSESVEIVSNEFVDDAANASDSELASDEIGAAPEEPTSSSSKALESAEESSEVRQDAESDDRSLSSSFFETLIADVKPSDSEEGIAPTSDPDVAPADKGEPEPDDAPIDAEQESPAPADEGEPEPDDALTDAEQESPAPADEGEPEPDFSFLNDNAPESLDVSYEGEPELDFSFLNDDAPESPDVSDEGEAELDFSFLNDDAPDSPVASDEGVAETGDSLPAPDGACLSDDDAPELPVAADEGDAETEDSLPAPDGACLDDDEAESLNVALVESGEEDATYAPSVGNGDIYPPGTKEGVVRSYLTGSWGDLTDDDSEEYDSLADFREENEMLNLSEQDSPFGTCFDSSSDPFQISSATFGESIFSLSSDVIMPTRPDDVYSNDKEGGVKIHDCKAYLVLPDNEKFSTIDGVLFSKDRKTLIQFPTRMTIARYVIPEGVEKIGPRAFEGALLEEVVLPEGVEIVGADAFRDCGSLVQIDFPQSVHTIAENVFEGCRRLRAINVSPKNKAYSSSQGVLFQNKNKLVKYPANKSGEEYAVPETIVKIEDRAFFDNYRLKRVYLSKKVWSIGDDAFRRQSAEVGDPSATPSAELSDSFATPFADASDELPKLPAELSDSFAALLADASDELQTSPAELHVYKNSIAHKWAKKHNAPFALIE